jgi:hypothetical protein
MARKDKDEAPLEIVDNSGGNPSVPEPEKHDGSVPEPEVPEASEPPEETAPETAPKPSPETAGRPNALKRFWAWCTEHKAVSIPLALVVVLGVLAAVPPTRYALAGMVFKEEFKVTVLDPQTNRPVSSATVRLGGKTLETNNNGRATFHVAAGNKHLTVSKKYYKTASAEVLVPLFKKGSTEVRLTATGRQVPVTVLDKISGKAVANATLQAEGTDVKTDQEGKAILVLPAGKQKVKVSVSADAYNTLASEVEITTSEVAANTFRMVPSGKLYFLSNATGKIDVVKTNLDGSGRETVLAGTGKEDKVTTVMLASRDWKYLALLSKRDGGDHAKLFLIETANDKVTTMDEGVAEFTLSGWYDSHFVYQVERANIQQWQPKKQALKSYDAVNKKITVLDETAAIGDNYGKYLSERLTPAYEVNGEVVFGKTVGMSGGLYENFKNTPATVVGIKPDGTARHVIKSWTPSGVDVTYLALDLKLYKPGELYILHTPQYSNKAEVWEYEDGKVKQTNIDTDTFYQNYATYLQSPSGDHTFWSEPRDGKNTILVGDKDGGNQKQILTLSEYQTYGWYTENYYLLSKGSSELYILAADTDVKTPPFKLTDYYKPAFNYPGYGGGYGGL